ncbi:molybdate ABC transporter substrate-binding protein [Vitreoscilla filiformis]|nr:molybdate ABC transporter substrate-binding protein [Vitreoscilla filiformis]
MTLAVFTRATRRASLGVFAALALAAAPAWAQTPAQTLTVSAAASLTNVLKTLGAQYEARHPGVKLQYNFAASGVLIQQIAQGAPVDVFISADEETMARGIGQKLLDATTRRDIASNQVVLIVPSSGAVPVAGLTGLKVEAVKRIAIGKLATVPVGRYTQQALNAAKLWGALEPKFVYADSVRQVLDYVARGEVEAGFVYATDAAVMADKVKVIQRVDGHDPVRYPAAVTADSKQKAAAVDFLAYLLSAPAQDALSKAGFGQP